MHGRILSAENETTLTIQRTYFSAGEQDMLGPKDDIIMDIC